MEGGDHSEWGKDYGGCCTYSAALWQVSLDKPKDFYLPAATLRGTMFLVFPSTEGCARYVWR